MFKKIIADNIANTRLAHIVQKIYATLELSIMQFYNDPKLIKLIKKIKQEEKQLLFKPSELAIIYSLAAAQRKIDGEYAEVGVYKGSSAIIICEAKAKKTLHLFDTFSGIPTNKKIDKRFSKHMFATSYKDVIKRFTNYHGVHIYKGVFPSSATPIKEKKFSFVHLDVDVYQSTLDSLSFFYQRLNSHGIILSHDYSSAAGVKKAFDDFFKDKPEAIIVLPMSQCMIIKQ